MCGINEMTRTLEGEKGTTICGNVIWLVVFFAFALSGSANVVLAQTADLIVFNGKIATVDGNMTMAEAMVIRDDIIIAVGANQDMLKLAGPDSKKLDVKGRTVLPGFIDPHWHMTGFMPQDFPEVKGINVPPSHDTGVVKKGIEEALKKRVKEVQPGEWIIINPTGDAARQVILYEEITRTDLDRWAPENPVMLNETGSGANSQILFSTKAREIIEKELPGFKYFSDRDIVFDGVNLSGLITKDILLKRKEKEYSSSIKKLLMGESSPKGITTLGTRITRTPLNSLFLLDQRGEMPVRFGWLFSDGSFYNGDGFYKRFPNFAGVGTKYLWGLGSGEEVTDSPSTALCTTLPIINRELKERLAKAKIDPCFLHNPVKRATVKDQIQYGRGVEYHASGDKTVEILLEIIDEIRRETGMTVEEIREKRLTMEHLHMVRPDQIPKLKEYGIIMSNTPGYLPYNLNPVAPANVLQNYGEQYLGWSLPAKSFINAGIRTVIGEAFGEPFDAMKMLITREACFTPRLPGEGEIGVEKCKVLAPEEKIDRNSALRMSTIWPAYYMLKEKELGSLEVGKLADFIVIDRDYFTVPEKEIKNIKVMMTVLGGKVVYATPDFGPVDRLLFKTPEYHGKAQLAGM
ncbi:MAG: amidohydrolase family protein [Acidobacteria bacterium]|nr:amidohydrolase family protein [Acidobacteriota bacterium]